MLYYIYIIYNIILIYKTIYRKYPKKNYCQKNCIPHHVLRVDIKIDIKDINIKMLLKK